jgi:ribosome-associated translation inhibitor RaiA
MQKPLEITFRDMTPSAPVEGAIRQWVERLEHTYDRIQSCSVVVAQPHQSQRRGNVFDVRIDLKVPGREIAVSREPARGTDHENAYVAVADAFRAVRRQLQHHITIRRRGAARAA